MGIFEITLFDTLKQQEWNLKELNFTNKLYVSVGIGKVA